MIWTFIRIRECETGVALLSFLSLSQHFKITLSFPRKITNIYYYFLSHYYFFLSRYCFNLSKELLFSFLNLPDSFLSLGIPLDITHFFRQSVFEFSASFCDIRKKSVPKLAPLRWLRPAIIK